VDAVCDEGLSLLFSLLGCVQRDPVLVLALFQLFLQLMASERWVAEGRSRLCLSSACNLFVSHRGNRTRRLWG
jgi:hypothetical protein